MDWSVTVGTRRAGPAPPEPRTQPMAAPAFCWPGKRQLELPGKFVPEWPARSSLGMARCVQLGGRRAPTVTVHWQA